MSQSFFGRPMEILLVEDSQTDAQMTMRSLKAGKVRHRLSMAIDGDEALKFLHREPPLTRAPRPDVILLDLQLPNMDGRELLKEIRSDDKLCDIPVIVMTSSSEHEAAILDEHLQVEAYLPKPIDHVAFIDLVRKLKMHWHADVILPV